LTVGIVFDIKRFSIHDGPGIRTTVFFKGCPLDCAWCHNPESKTAERERMFWEGRCIRCGACQAACEQEAIAFDGAYPITYEERCTLCGSCVQACHAEARQIIGREMTVSQVMSEIERDVAFYDESGGGVTFSGGEPLMQPEFLRQLLRACREQEIHTAVDTCGFAPWEVLESLRNDVGLFLYDIKLLDDARHRQFTGMSNTLILSNLRALAARGHHLIVRVPVIPGINDDQESLNQVGAFASTLANLDRLDILPYHHTAASKYERLGKSYDLSRLRPPTEERMAEIAETLGAFGLQIRIGG
jgi:pyruvate formate lyase activating enzyme